MNQILGAILLYLISSCRMHTLANEREDSIQLDWKKETGSSFWEAEVNSFDVPSGAVVEVKGPKDGLIRVTGDQSTSIYGTITSSNPVYVINPNGVVVGPGASINDDTLNLIRTKNAQENLKQTKPLLWELESNARAGDADAQYNLGKYYASRNLHKFGYSGWPNPEKQEEAFMWFKRSAEQGNAKGQYGVGQCYMTGIGVTKNQQKALLWFMKSAIQGYDEAQYALGTCYVSGVGSAFDYKEGFKWYMRAAEQGYACAQNALGCYYIEGKMGTPKDEKKAVIYFTKSSEGGCLNGLKHLAICYHEGIGVTKDEKAVTKWRTNASFLKKITCCSIFWPKGDVFISPHLTFTSQSGSVASYELLTDWDEYLATRSGASLKEVDIKKGKKDMKRAFALDPGARPPEVTVTSYTAPIDVSYGKNALYDYLWLGDIRVGGLSEIKEEQGSFGRNGTTIFPNNPQPPTNPQ